MVYPKKSSVDEVSHHLAKLCDNAIDVENRVEGKFGKRRQ